MARGAAQTRRKTAKPQTGERKRAAARRPPSIESEMFFPRLRRQAKWVFIFLAFVFAAGFVFFGVGSGSTGISGLLQGNFNIFGNSGGSGNSSAVNNALKQTKAHPNDPAAWTNLATAYQTDGKSDDANTANLHVLKLRPNDTSALQNVAAYYEARAQTKYTEAQNLQAAVPITIGTLAGVTSTSPLGQMLGSDVLTQQTQQKVQTAFSGYTTALQQDAGYYKRLAKLQPTDVNTQFLYAQLAEATGDPTSAIAAYKRVVKLAPHDPSAQQAKQRIKLLAASTQSTKPR